jgi:hypothetical protein
MAALEANEAQAWGTKMCHETFTNVALSSAQVVDNAAINRQILDVRAELYDFHFFLRDLVHLHVIDSG